MPGIICSIRGGPASQSTIRHAIELAKRERCTLTFLYVVNLDFLTRTMTSRVASIQEDMRQMGELLLSLAVETAVAEGVDAQKAVREGHVAEQIEALCREEEVDFVVVGAPLKRQETTIFTSEEVESLGNHLHASCQAELIIVA